MSTISTITNTNTNMFPYKNINTSQCQLFQQLPGSWLQLIKKEVELLILGTDLAGAVEVLLAQKFKHEQKKLGSFCSNVMVIRFCSNAK